MRVERAIRVYADTTVYGGVFDDEFTAASRTFFEHVRRGRFHLVLSRVVRDELEEAPTDVRSFFEDIRRRCETVDVTDEAVVLQQAYLQAGVVGRNWEADALHVAVATVSGCRLLVSWNFRHIVHFDKIPVHNGVNLAQGYGSLAIHTSREVIQDEDEDV